MVVVFNEIVEGDGERSEEFVVVVDAYDESRVVTVVASVAVADAEIVVVVTISEEEGCNGVFEADEREGCETCKGGECWEGKSDDIAGGRVLVCGAAIVIN